jgi:hypothetical protein
VKDIPQHNRGPRYAIRETHFGRDERIRRYEIQARRMKSNPREKSIT